jgi:hypothetical protein
LATDEHALLLQISADNSRILKSFDQIVAKVNKGADVVEQRARRMAQNVEQSGRLLGDGFGVALEKMFSSTRLAVLEEGTARFRLMGGAVEALGAAGVVGAAGLAALFITMEHAEKAVDAAAGIAKLGKEVGVSTDFIQKFNFAAHQNEIEVTAADEALKNLNTSFGLVQSGLARKQQVNAFAALLGTDPGKTPEILRQFQNVGDFFPVLAKRIGEVGNAAERAAIAKRLGISELLPMLTGAENGFDALAKKAEDLGIVMSRSTIEKAEEAKRKLSELNDVMKSKANVAFAEFSDTLVQIKQLFLDAEVAGLKFLAAITGTEPTSLARLKELREEVARITDKSGQAISPFLVGQLQHDRAAIAKMEKDLAAKPEGPKPPPVKPLVGTGTKATDQTASFDKSATDALNSAREADAKATAALIDGIQAHAAAEKAAVDAGLTKKLADLEAEAQKIAKAKNDADKLSQRAKINSAKAAEAEAAETEKRVIDQKAATAALEQFLAYSQRIHADYARISSNTAAMADTAAQRNAIERQALLAEQRNELFAFDQRAQDELSRLTGPDLARRRSELDAERGATVDRQQSDQVRQTFDQAGPLDAYLRKIRDLNTAFQEDGVTFIQDMTSGLLQLAAQGKLTAQSLENIFLNLLVKMAAQELASEAAPGLATAFKVGLSFLGLAGGGRVSGPGTSTSDSIPIMGSDGEYMVNAASTRKYLPVLEAINSGRPLHLAAGGMVGSSYAALRSMSFLPPRAAGGVTVIQPLHFHAEGAVLGEELLNQANRYTDAAASHAAAAAVRAGRTGLAGAMRSDSLLKG